jgi:hypothetical protein
MDSKAALLTAAALGAGVAVAFRLWTVLTDDSKSKGVTEPQQRGAAREARAGDAPAAAAAVDDRGAGEQPKKKKKPRRRNKRTDLCFFERKIGILCLAFECLGASGAHADCRAEQGRGREPGSAG